jgi:ferredoxin
VFVAAGELKGWHAEYLGLQTGPQGIVTDAGTYQTSLPGVFAGGDAVRVRRLTVRAVADGKEAAISIGQYLSGQEVTGPIKAFNTHIGKLSEAEMEIFVAGASTAPRVTPSQEGVGLTHEQAGSESVRCLHCDCRKAGSCRLRRYAQEYKARPTRYKPPPNLEYRTRKFEVRNSGFDIPHSVCRDQHPDIIYEPGKCINCGLCVRIATQAGEELGLTFVGRGFDVRVAVPFDGQLSEALKNAGKKCVAACPTGALAFKRDPASREPDEICRT